MARRQCDGKKGKELELGAAHLGLYSPTIFFVKQRLRHSWPTQWLLSPIVSSSEAYLICVFYIQDVQDQSTQPSWRRVKGTPVVLNSGCPLGPLRELVTNTISLGRP